MRAKLTLRNIEDNLCFTATEAWAWFVLPTQPWAFRSDTQREQLLFGVGDALAWLAGHRLHLRVTTRPVPVGGVGAPAHQLTPDPLTTAGAEPWSDHMVTMQKHLRHQTMAEKQVFLGVRLATGRRATGSSPRSGGTRATSSTPGCSPRSSASPRPSRCPAWTVAPPRPRRWSGCCVAPSGSGLPAPADLSAVETAAWDADDLHSFTDHVDYAAAPLGRTVKLTSRGATTRSSGTSL